MNDYFCETTITSSNFKIRLTIPDNTFGVIFNLFSNKKNRVLNDIVLTCRLMMNGIDMTTKYIDRKVWYEIIFPVSKLEHDGISTPIIRNVSEADGIGSFRVFPGKDDQYTLYFAINMEQNKLIEDEVVMFLKYI